MQMLTRGLRIPPQGGHYCEAPSPCHNLLNIEKQRDMQERLPGFEGWMDFYGRKCHPNSVSLEVNAISVCSWYWLTSYPPTMQPHHRTHRWHFWRSACSFAWGKPSGGPSWGSARSEMTLATPDANFHFPSFPYPSTSPQHATLHFGAVCSSCLRQLRWVGEHASER